VETENTCEKMQKKKEKRHSPYVSARVGAKSIRAPEALKSSHRNFGALDTDPAKLAAIW